MAHKPNALINESSPYLLQHAYNPVEWYAWSDEVLEKAKAEDKLILVSIGYSSCHWCHVMERESFENTEVAERMNRWFINVKVDREERPDIDHLYMSAVQLMTGRGGWPLNCFILPDGRAVYGGTYFPKERWMGILENLHTIWKTERDRMYEYADQLLNGMQKMQLAFSIETDSLPDVTRMVDIWKAEFDSEFGGPDRAPKFPMPDNYRFLMHYAASRNDKTVADHVKLTLTQMYYGGIFDQAGGGFSRYSTDVYWKIPHFEKMLYDNSQLISLYADAFKAYGDEEYLECMKFTIDFCVRELKLPNGLFASAIDADSEGEEGKFYVWETDGLSDIFGDQYPLVRDYFNLNSQGHWEHGRYILCRGMEDSWWAEKYQIPVEEVRSIVADARATFLSLRSGRIRPMTDTKALTSWNAMMVKALADASYVDSQYAHQAGDLMKNILRFRYREDDTLIRCERGDSAVIEGFLEDYAHMIEALLALYSADFNPEWVLIADRLCTKAGDLFSDGNSPYLRFHAPEMYTLVTDTYELTDNVIPASNSVMAHSFYTLGLLMGKPEWLQRAGQMLSGISSRCTSYPSGYSNWARLSLRISDPSVEIVLTGPDRISTASELRNLYLPSTLLVVSTAQAELPIMFGRQNGSENAYYVCEGNSCQLPVRHLSDLRKQLKLGN